MSKFDSFFAITEPRFSALRGRGLTLTLEYEPHCAVLVINSKTDRRIEVRGHRGIGTVYEGGPLDRIIDSIPRKHVNLSELFAEAKCGVPTKCTDPIIDALEFENMLVTRVQTAKGYMA